MTAHTTDEFMAGLREIASCHGTGTWPMPFGRHRGKPLRDVPRKALEHYLNWDQLFKETRSIIEAELRRRDEKETV